MCRRLRQQSRARASNPTGAALVALEPVLTGYAILVALRDGIGNSGVLDGMRGYIVAQGEGRGIAVRHCRAIYRAVKGLELAALSPRRGLHLTDTAIA